MNKNIITFFKWGFIALLIILIFLILLKADHKAYGYQVLTDIGLNSLSGNINSLLYNLDVEQKTSKEYFQISRTDANIFDYKVHTYKTPDGTWGYVLYILVNVDDQEYVRIINNGPEDSRTRDWLPYLNNAF